MKKQVRFGFTLVELLVVISIIGMLAGLLLPAINAAREAGRRATCMANQSQIALAFLNYENNRGYLPPMIGEVYTPSTAYHWEGTTYTGSGASWVGFLLMYLEYNAAWDRLSGGRGWNYETDNAIFEKLPIPILKCRSASKPSDDNSISYVVNGGYQNAFGTWASTTARWTPPGGTETRFSLGKREEAPFFNCYAHSTASGSGPIRGDKVRVSVDYISVNSGTSYTILLSENMQAGNWIEAETDGTSARAQLTTPSNWCEEEVAFFFPLNAHGNLNSARSAAISANARYPYTGAETSAPDKSLWSYNGFCSPNATLTAATYGTPMFINEDRMGITYPAHLNGGVAESSRYARPSSMHPGVVVATFADRSTRVLAENMNRELFVNLCRPKSGTVINPAELNQ